MTEVATLHLERPTEVASIDIAEIPVFGQTPAPYERPPQLRDALGSELYGRLVEHEDKDGFSIVTRIMHPAIGEEGVRQLFEEIEQLLALEGLAGEEASATLLQALMPEELRQPDAKYRPAPPLEGETSETLRKRAFEQFLAHVSVQPDYRYGKERDPKLSLDEFSRRFLRGAVRPAPTKTGTQEGLPEEGLVITTGENRFTPGKPETIEIAVMLADEQTGERQIAFKEIELGDDLAEIELASFFYWDAEPTIEALLDMGEFEKVLRVLNSYAHYCEHRGGNILNWNNTSVDRSQPPMFWRMVEKAAEYMGDEVLVRYLKPMTQHFNFWRDGMELRDADGTIIQEGKLGMEPGSAYRRTARLKDGEGALRNADDLHDHTRPDNPIEKCHPRQEMDEHDTEDLASFEAFIGRKLTPEERCDFFAGIFGAAETGQDFTEDQSEIPEHVKNVEDYKRWQQELKEERERVERNGGVWRHQRRLITHHLINPALNAMYAEGALVIAKAWRAAARQDPGVADHAEGQAALYENEADRIRVILHKYNYNKDDAMFGMYDFVRGATDIEAGRRPALSINGVIVLSSGMTDRATANEVLEGIDRNFLRPGGLIATSRDFESNRQWDGKTSWPILVRECVKAAIRYERYDLAVKWLKIHLKSNEMLYASIGHLGEKNDSSQPGKAIVIGEYGPQDIAMTYSSHLWMRKTLWYARKARVAQVMGSGIARVWALLPRMRLPADDSKPSPNGRPPAQRKERKQHVPQ